ncbi:wiskott-Aldrich syndrome protein family member 1-like [Schistocerca nitens]|uniref:wiskott-Aldrich syndrome protein family member 1-like n=1 Tax=Schistocerca nitens TaxID=7011 RepID=UPI0021197742|nr:wiskott-Aldrich syndrome protein family member 1-like [Schistocerca nitens]
MVGVQQQPSSPQRLQAPAAPPPARPAAPFAIVDEAPAPLAPPPPMSQPSQQRPHVPLYGQHPADVDGPMPLAPSLPASPPLPQRGSARLARHAAPYSAGASFHRVLHEAAKAEQDDVAHLSPPGKGGVYCLPSGSPKWQAAPHNSHAMRETNQQPNRRRHQVNTPKIPVD